MRQEPEAPIEKSIQLEIDAATVFLPVTVASGFPALRPAVLRASLFTFARFIFNGLFLDSFIGCWLGG